jgi:hypothetical protein
MAKQPEDTKTQELDGSTQRETITVAFNAKEMQTVLRALEVYATSQKRAANNELMEEIKALRKADHDRTNRLINKLFEA